MDVDIDFANRTDITSRLPHTLAGKHDEYLKPHPCGVYFQKIPRDSISQIATIDFNVAQQYGFFKIDLLNLTLLKHFSSRIHLKRVLHQEPQWHRLKEQEFVDKIFHIRGHWDVLQENLPTSIYEMAMVLAMIRPAKRHLVGRSWSEIEQEIWIEPEKGYWFKKSHSLAYAHTVVLNMNLLTYSPLD